MWHDVGSSFAWFTLLPVAPRCNDRLSFIPLLRLHLFVCTSKIYWIGFPHFLGVIPLSSGINEGPRTLFLRQQIRSMICGLHIQVTASRFAFVAYSLQPQHMQRGAASNMHKKIVRGTRKPEKSLS